eukprot:3925146-Pleurochrysis_carterae.AAC.1
MGHLFRALRVALVAQLYRSSWQRSAGARAMNTHESSSGDRADVTIDQVPLSEAFEINLTCETFKNETMGAYED